MVILVLLVVEVAHADFTKVTRVEFVKIYAHMAKTTNVTTARGVLSVPANATVAHLNMTALFPGPTKTSWLFDIR